MNRPERGSSLMCHESHGSPTGIWSVNRMSEAIAQLPAAAAAGLGVLGKRAVRAEVRLLGLHEAHVADAAFLDAQGLGRTVLDAAVDRALAVRADPDRP